MSCLQLQGACSFCLLLVRFWKDTVCASSDVPLLFAARFAGDRLCHEALLRGCARPATSTGIFVLRQTGCYEIWQHPLSARRPQPDHQPSLAGYDMHVIHVQSVHPNMMRHADETYQTVGLDLYSRKSVDGRNGSEGKASSKVV